MKKLLTMVAIVAAAITNVYAFEKEELKDIKQTQIKVLSFLSASNNYVYTWTSTCGIKHETTFTGNWTAQEIAIWISDKNKSECGVRPKNVIVDLAPSML